MQKLSEKFPIILKKGSFRTVLKQTQLIQRFKELIKHFEFYVEK